MCRPNPGSNGFGESIGALQATIRVVREYMLGQTPSDLLLDQACQPGRTPSETINAVHGAPTMAPESTPSNMELDEVTRTIRNVIIRNRLLSLLQGCPQAERSELNDPVLFRNYTARCFPYVDTGTCFLPPDAWTKNDD